MGHRTSLAARMARPKQKPQRPLLARPNLVSAPFWALVALVSAGIPAVLAPPPPLLILPSKWDKRARPAPTRTYAAACFCCSSHPLQHLQDSRRRTTYREPLRSGLSVPPPSIPVLADVNTSEVFHCPCNRIPTKESADLPPVTTAQGCTSPLSVAHVDTAARFRK